MGSRDFNYIAFSKNESRDRRLPFLEQNKTGADGNSVFFPSSKTK